MADNEAKNKIIQILGPELTQQVEAMPDDTAVKLATIMAKTNVKSRKNTAIAPYGATLYTNYGSVNLDSSLANIDYMYINGQKFSVKENGLDAIAKATGTEAEIRDVLGDPEGRQSRGRKVRSRVDNPDISIEEVQAITYQDLKNSGLSYDSLFQDLGGLMKGTNIDVSDISDELFANKIPEEDIAHFLVYDSQYKNDVISKVHGQNLGAVASDYNFVPQTQDDTFIGRLMTRLDIDEAEYDAKAGILKVGDRHITNLPEVDELGVFHNGDTRYLPYYNGYYTADAGTRVERLRVIDPVASALDSLALQYSVTNGDVKFKTILDVTRNLPDFETHPYGDEILDTLKHKIVIDKEYGKTNSLLADYSGKADGLGAVALTMLDDDAEGYIDPMGTSNGGNMGKIMFMADGVTVNDDGSLNKSDNRFSKVGEVLKDYALDADNFNRNQMSFNAFLTSLDVKNVKVAFSEFALFNSEDAMVATKKGAETMFDTVKETGDKLTDRHGNKGTIALIVDPDMPEDEAKAQKLDQAVNFVKANPNLDLVVSPISVASRLNMGVTHEGLAGEKEDLHLTDGTVVKDGITTMMYMSLPQTAEHKSKDYSVEGNGRRYSTLLHYALASKVGKDLYSKALINDDVRQEHIDEIVTAFGRLGISFENNNDLIADGNVNTFIDAPAEIDANSLHMSNVSTIRSNLMANMKDGRINIQLDDDMAVTSPLTNEPIQDSLGFNVLPICVDKNGTIPYRYTGVFEALSLGNKDLLVSEFQHATSVDYTALTRKDNLLKNVETMSFTDNARTDVLLPDPRLNIEDVRSCVESDRVIIHRDPAIQSGNIISMNNVKGGKPNVTMVNPLIEVEMDADNDGDNVGNNGYNNLNLSDAEKDEFFAKSSVEEQVNQYGRVFLGTDSSHFKAAVMANGIDDSNITFEDGKSNRELVDIVNDTMHTIVTSDKSYGAYAISFENTESVKNTLSAIADDGIKGDKDDITRIFDEGYTKDENRAVLKALIAKSEWTGLAGATTNNLIAGLSGDSFDKDMVRVSMDVTHSMTQSVLQMKKNADKLPVIDKGIKDMKAVMSGKYGTEQSRELLKSVTNGLIEPEAIDKFVDEISEHQVGEHFGEGVINDTEITTKKLAYVTGENFGKALLNISNDPDVDVHMN